MEANEGVHPLVTLLTERMKSHPEEFEDDYAVTEDAFDSSVRGRWQYAIQEIYNHGSDQDGDALRTGMRSIRLDKAHQWVLDELLNGDERRAQAKRKREEEEKLHRTLMAQSARQNIYANAQINANGLQQAQLQGMSINGARPVWESQTPSQQRFYDRVVGKLLGK